MKKLLAISAALLFAVVATHASASDGSLNLKVQSNTSASISKEEENEHKEFIRTIKHQLKGFKFGTVSEVKSDGSFTIENKKGNKEVTVTTTASTSYTKDSQPADKTAVPVGAMVGIKGAWDKTTSSIKASVVSVFDKLRGTQITGTVTAASATSLTVKGDNNITYTVDISKAQKVRGKGFWKTKAAIQVGDKVQVWGTLLEGSTNITARRVHEIRTFASPSPSVSPSPTPTP